MGWKTNIRTLQMLVLGGHPNETDLAAFVDGGLPHWQQPWIERHLAACDDCCDQIGMLVKSQRVEIEVDPALIHGAALLARSDRLSRDSKPRWRLVAATSLAVGALATFAAVVFVGHSPTAPIVPIVKTTPSVPTVVSQLASAEPGRSQLAAHSYVEIVRSRRTGPRVLVFSPRGGSRLDAPPLIQWRSIPHAIGYDVRLLSVSGDVLWMNRFHKERATIPDTVHLARGNKYFVIVRAYLVDGKTIDSSAIEFSLLPS